MTHDEIYTELRALAPSVAFFASSAPDPDFDWDGDGPDPAEEGMMAVDVTVTALAVADGAEVTGEAYLGGHYLYPNEEAGDIGGYLPQKLAEAADHLVEQLPPLSPLRHELAAVRAFLDREMRDRYDRQRTEIEAGRTPKGST
jgi:hypothetical protein